MTHTLRSPSESPNPISTYCCNERACLSMATASDIANNKQAFDLLNQPQVEAISSLVEGLQLANLAAIEEFGSWCSGSLTDTSTSLPLPEGHDLDTKKLLSQAVRAVVVLYSGEPIISASAWSPTTLKDKAAKIISSTLLTRPKMPSS